MLPYSTTQPSKTMDVKRAMKYSRMVANWLRTKGYTVEYSYNAVDEIQFADKKIIISTRTSPENRLYSLLHECGHLLEYNNSASYRKKYPLAERILLDARTQQSIQGRVETVGEEIEAWNKGEKLADRLGIKMNKQRYKKYAAKQVITYIDWASER